ncbi:biotin carboxyl carrier domain-containing protein [Jiella sp. MQZ9-1]|uniref:Biotin carboxyl carrier protein of acetyl-CoA carboxylase n=1 Tax=Jiella flava TaxID=2816857 RepID=A0A939FXX5_9HYPH|nr:acetyl-CoA carboxylase [Jiella flava]MBO0661424.1 biotin carboxyl carrier domain-containing protein [Jiella flava]MCD2470067.1 biotin carboxyl carrier domain-containing protein [Jiella flava]
MAKQLLSPLPGVFYRRPSPDEANFKNDGDAVAAGDTVGIVEAMKSFFPIEAEEAGVAIRFLVEDGAAIDAAQAIAEMD